MAWRDATQLVTLLDRPEPISSPGVAAPVRVKDPAPKPPLVSRSPQSMKGAELEAGAAGLETWLNAYAARGDSPESVRAVQQRDALRAELTRRAQQQADAKALGGLEAFRTDLDALAVEPADAGGVRNVMRNGSLLGAIVASAEGFHFAADGQLALAEGTPYASPEGAAVALSRFMAGIPEDQPLAERGTSPLSVEAPRFVLTKKDKKDYPGADPSMWLKTHLAAAVLHKQDPDQHSQRVMVELCQRHGRPEAGTHLSSGGRLAIITVAPDTYDVRAPDRLTHVFGPWGQQLKSRERANRVADALESIRDAQGQPFPWDMENPTFRALTLTAMHWRDQHGHDIKQAIWYALVTQGLDERDGRYAEAYFQSTGRRLRDPARSAPAAVHAPVEADPSVPGAVAFEITTVKKLGEVAALDGTFWWKGEVKNPRQQGTPRPLLDTPILVRVKESPSEEGASRGWGQILDAATGEVLQRIRSTSHVLVAARLDTARTPGAVAPIEQRFASLNMVRTHLMHARIPGLTPQRRKDLRKIAGDRQLRALTEDGQFALRLDPASETYEVIPAGSGLPFSGFLPDLYLSPDARTDLTAMPRPLEGFSSLEEAREFAGRLTELRLTDDTPIDWSDPRLGLDIDDAEMVVLNHTILEERAHHDRAHDHGNSPSDQMWTLFEDDAARREEPGEGMQWSDGLVPGSWVWLTINDEYKLWEIHDSEETAFGTVALTFDDQQVLQFPRNLPIQRAEDEVYDSEGRTLGVRLHSDYVHDDDIIEFDLGANGRPVSPSGPGGAPAPGVRRLRGRALVTHRHAHGGGERALLRDATSISGDGHEAASAELALAAYELPEHVYRLSRRAALAVQPIQPQAIAMPPLDADTAAPPEERQEEPDFATDPEAVPQHDADADHELAEQTDSEERWEEALQAALRQDAPEESEPQSDADRPAEEPAPTNEEQEASSQLDADHAQLQQGNAEEARTEEAPRNEAALPIKPSEGEALRQSLLRLLRDPSAPTTPTQHTVLDNSTLYVQLFHSPRNGRVVRFGFDPTSPRAAAQFTADELEGATGEQVLRGVLARRPPNGLREDLLNLMGNPAAPSAPTFQSKVGGLDLYVAVTGHAEHGTVLRFGFDPKSPAAGLFTRDDLQGTTSTKLVQSVERYGATFVQHRLDHIDTGRASQVRDLVEAAAKQRQLSQRPSSAAPSGAIRHQRPDDAGREPAPAVSPSR